MSDNTTAMKRLLDESNKLWDAMYIKGEVPTYGERYYFFRAMADAMDEDAKLRGLVRELYEDQCDECDRWKYRDRMRELGIEVDA